MRVLICKIAVGLAVACGYAAAVSCGDDGGGSPDGGSGGTGGAMDASDGPAGTVGCLTPDMVPTTCPTPAVTFENVKPIIQAQCVSVCHNGVTPDPNLPGETIWALRERQHLLDWHAFGPLHDGGLLDAPAGRGRTRDDRRAARHHRIHPM